MQTTEKYVRHFSHHLLFVPDSSGMWEEQEEEDGAEEDDDEDEGLAGQLLSDIIASNKYGIPQTSAIPVFYHFHFHEYIALHEQSSTMLLLVTLFLFIRGSF